jgi:hypothetical protein
MFSRPSMGRLPVIPDRVVALMEVGLHQTVELEAELEWVRREPVDRAVA